MEIRKSDLGWVNYHICTHCHCITILSLNSSPAFLRSGRSRKEQTRHGEKEQLAGQLSGAPHCCLPLPLHCTDACLLPPSHSHIQPPHRRVLPLDDLHLLLGSVGKARALRRHTESRPIIQDISKLENVIDSFILNNYYIIIELFIQILLNEHF